MRTISEYILRFKTLQLREGSQKNKNRNFANYQKNRNENGK